MAGDVFVTVSLAGSLFFDVGVGRGPAQGPALPPVDDGAVRGGRARARAVPRPDPRRPPPDGRGARWPGRAVLCMLMANKINSPLLYPLAFGALVLSKGQSVAKSSLVPAVVDSHDELVLANSRLAIISVLGATVAAPFAALDPEDRRARRGCCARARSCSSSGTMCAFGIPRAKQVGQRRRRSTSARRCTRAASSSPGPRWGCCAASSASSRSSPRSR